MFVPKLDPPGYHPLSALAVASIAARGDGSSMGFGDRRRMAFRKVAPDDKPR